MIVYKTSEKIPLQIGKVTVYVSPLSALQYANIMSLKSAGDTMDSADGVKMALQTLRYSIKDIQSDKDIEYSDGSKFSLGFTPSGELTEESLSAVVQILGAVDMTTLANKILLNSFQLPKDGVEIESRSPVTKKKK